MMLWASQTANRRTVSLGLSTRLVLPPHPGSLRLGRHATLAWLQVAPQRYDNGTVLLLVTELLAEALEQANGPLVLTVAAEDRQVRVEVAAGAPPETVPGRGSRLKMTALLADQWGVELRLPDEEPAQRVVWFACRCLLPERGRQGRVTRSG